MLKIIARLWSVIYDLLLYIDGSRRKSIDEIRTELDVIELQCRPYAEAGDIENILWQEGGGSDGQ